MSGTDIFVADNFLPPEEQQAVWGYLCGPGWSFGAYSGEGPKASRYFYKHFAGYRKDSAAESVDPARLEDELVQEAPLIAGVWGRLKARRLGSHRLTRCYANGLPVGVDGSLHLDSNVDSHLTAIYYPHTKWDPDYSGETVFFDKSGSDIVASVYPKPNRMVIFPGTIPHVARAVSRHGPDLRVTLMFKTMPAA